MTHIEYDYDPLYRLVKAEYSGDVSAGYTYIYDAVGNMTAYEETIGTVTSSVNRTFNAANQLLVSVDSEAGSSIFTYDNNGNLERINLPGFAEEKLLYTYNQRNLLTLVSRQVGYTAPQEEAAFVYDGDGNRLQQIDHTGSQLVTTTYTNDILGLSQVLVSDDGTTATYNLFGLDLISQDNGTETRFMLADGLGSVRTEMVGDSIETATTYEPYGKLLAQTGNSGTVYGFTGEQYDAATGLVYLRARYYSPLLKIFLSRDPFPGYDTLSVSQNGYAYVHSNPVNHTDPTGNWVWAASEATLRETNDEAMDIITSAVHRKIYANLHVPYSSVWHAEYPIPGTSYERIDLLNSAYGYLWEIKPRYKEAEAQAQINGYRIAMNAGRGNLHGSAPTGGPYNWNYDPQRWILGPRGTFPSKELLGQDPSGWWDIYYGQTQDGVIVWWKERRQRQEVRVLVPIPEWVAWSEKNTYPSLSSVPIPVPVPQPGPQGTPVPPAMPGFPPWPNPQPVPTPIHYYSTPIPICLSSNSKVGNSAVTAGGTTLVVYIVYRVVRAALSPGCGPAAPLCAFGP